MKPWSALLLLGGLLSLCAGAVAAAPAAAEAGEEGDTRLQRLNRAYGFFIAGHPRRARELWRQLDIEHSGDRPALLGLAAGALAAGDSGGFLRARTKMRQSPSVSSEGRALEAATELAGQPGSLSWLESLSERLPLSPLPPFALGVIRVGLGHWQRACRDFAEARSRAPAWPDLVYNLAACVDRLGQGRRAARLYRQALALAERRPAQFAVPALVRRLARLTQREGQAAGESGKESP